MRKEKLLPKRVEMEFEGGLVEEVTAHAGVVLLVETGRRSGVLETADRVMLVKKNPKGLGQGQMVESFVILSALGGECLDDFEALRTDCGLQAMVGILPEEGARRGGGGRTATAREFHTEGVGWSGGAEGVGEADGESIRLGG